MSQQPVLLTGVVDRRPANPSGAELSTSPDVASLEMENAALRIMVHTLRDYISQLQARHARFDSESA